MTVEKEKIKGVSVGIDLGYIILTQVI